MQRHNRCDIKRLKNDTLYFEIDYLKPLPEGAVLHLAALPIDIISTIMDARNAIRYRTEDISDSELKKMAKEAAADVAIYERLT